MFDTLKFSAVRRHVLAVAGAALIAPQVWAADPSTVTVAGYGGGLQDALIATCLLYTSPSPRDLSTSRMPSSA